MQSLQQHNLGGFEFDIVHVPNPSSTSRYQQIKHIKQSSISGDNLLLFFSNILPPAFKADSDATVEAEGVSRSRAMMERTGKALTCSFHHVKR